jgi:hypothetical protein
MRAGGFLQAFFAAQPRCTLRVGGEASSSADAIQHSHRTCHRQSGRYALAVALVLLKELPAETDTSKPRGIERLITLESEWG